jgi:hypothetical protein
MQKGMLVHGKLPRNLGARERPGDVDLNRTDRGQPVYRRVKFCDQLLVVWSKYWFKAFCLFNGEFDVRLTEPRSVIGCGRSCAAEGSAIANS